MGEDISSELRNKSKIVLNKPAITPDLETKYQAKQRSYLSKKHRALAAAELALADIETTLATAEAGPERATLIRQQGALANEIEQLQEDIDDPPEMELRGADKTEYDGL